MFPTAQDVREARARIAPFVRHTHMEASPGLAAVLGSPAFLKIEALQVSGSFKPRISFNKLLAMGETERRRGVVASTAGGHGIRLSYAAGVLGMPVTICLPCPSQRGSLQSEILRRDAAALRPHPGISQLHAMAARR